MALLSLVRRFHKNIFFISAFSKDILDVCLSAAKLKRRFEFLVLLRYLILRFSFNGFIRMSQISTIRTVLEDGI